MLYVHTGSCAYTNMVYLFEYHVDSCISLWCDWLFNIYVEKLYIVTITSSQ